MTSHILIALGDRIRELRNARGWRQIDLAQHSGIHEVHLSRLESGNHQAGVETVKRIADAFGVSLSEMFKGL